MGNANPAHIILAVSYLNMLFTSIKTPVPNRKLYMDFLISSTAKNTVFKGQHSDTKQMNKNTQQNKYPFLPKNYVEPRSMFIKKENKSQVPPSLGIVTDATRDNNSSQLRAGPCITKWLVYYGLETPALVGLYLKVKKVMGYLAPAQLRSRLGLRSL